MRVAVWCYVLWQVCSWCWVLFFLVAFGLLLVRGTWHRKSACSAER